LSVKRISIDLDYDISLQLDIEAKNSRRTRKQLVEYIIMNHFKVCSNESLEESNISSLSQPEPTFLSFDDIPSI